MTTQTNTRAASQPGALFSPKQAAATRTEIRDFVAAMPIVILAKAISAALKK